VDLGVPGVHGGAIGVLSGNPNIVAVSAVGSDRGGSSYLVMQLLLRGSLGFLFPMARAQLNLLP
jgi:serine/threonine protein kinase